MRNSGARWGGHEPDLRVEVPVDHHAVNRKTVPVGSVGEVSPVAGLVGFERRRRRAGDVAADVDILEEGEIPVDPDECVRAGSDHRLGAVGDHHTDGAATQHVAARAQHGEVGQRDPGCRVGPARDVRRQRYLPARPDRRPPPRIGITMPLASPMRRL